MRLAVALVACAACVSEPPRPACSGGPAPIPEIDDPTSNEGDPWLSYDRLELLFTSDREGGVGGTQIWRATRTSQDQPFGGIAAIGWAGDGNDHQGPSLSDDGLTLYFAAKENGLQDFAIWSATRADRLSDQFSAPEMVVDLGQHPSVTSDGLTVYFWKHGADDRLYTATRTKPSGMFSNATEVVELSSAGNVSDPSISGDGKTLVYALNDNGTNHIYRAHKTGAVFDQPELATETRIPNATGTYLGPMLHRDGATILFASDVQGGPTTTTDVFVTCP